MTWTYSGDPSKSDLDRYRFLISDTIETDPVLQDEEINYLLAEYSAENSRLYRLFDRCADLMARKIKKSLGPQSEDPTNRVKYFQDKAKYYRQLSSSTGIGTVNVIPATFSKGMFDNPYAEGQDPSDEGTM